MPKEDFSDKENYKSETTFTFPMDFDDDFLEQEDEVVVHKEKVEKPDIPKRTETRSYNERNYSEFLNRKEEKKHFKPTPIISPVYGILDQNYKKEDVIVKKDVLRHPSNLSLEEVRKRAFGSLEDDLENNLTKEQEKIKTEKIKVEHEVILEHPYVVEDKLDQSKSIEELENDFEENSINEEEIENTNKEEVVTPKNSIDDLINDEEKQVKDNDDEIDDEEADLFSLIDSIYEEKGE